MNISVIIPALNEESHIASGVASSWAARANEVIVADGGSSDRTIEIAAALDCQLVQSSSGRACQQNAAARIATGDVLLFVHADNRLVSEGCDQIRERLASGTAICGAFRQRIEAPQRIYRLLEIGNAARVRWLGSPYGDQGIFVRREVFQQIGGFPVAPLLEDLLLMKRLRRIGWPSLLPGPLYVSARRWQRSGVVRQTLRNWLLLSAYGLGVPPERLARFYARNA